MRSAGSSTQRSAISRNCYRADGSSGRSVLLVKASIAGAIVTNTLFMLGGSFLIGGLRHHEQQFNRVSARLQSSLLFLATVGLLVPSLVAQADGREMVTQTLSLGLAVLLTIAYGLSLVLPLKTHKEAFASVGHGEVGEMPWPIGVALIVLAAVTVLVALVSHVFVSSVQQAAETLGMSPAFVGFIVVALVGRRRNRDRLLRSRQKPARPQRRHRARQRGADRALRHPLLVVLSWLWSGANEPAVLAGAIAMMLFATMAATLMANGGRSAWFVGVMILMVYAIFALTLFLLPPAA